MSTIDAAKAAWDVFLSSGLEKLERGDIYLADPQDPNTDCTIRYYARLPLANPNTGVTLQQTVVFSMMITAERVFSQVVAEPEHRILYGVGEAAPTREGAATEAAKMVEVVTKSR